MPTLEATGLTAEQHSHFSEHGWLMLENVLDAEQCQRHIDALDESLEHFAEPWIDTPNIHWLHNLHLLGPQYLEWFKLPGMMASIRQLIGTDMIHVISTVAVLSEPHPDRQARRQELADRSTWGWHRDFVKPEYVVSPHPTDAGLITAGKTIALTYLTPISPDNGVTAFIDRSHVVDGTPYELAAQGEVVQPTAPAGSVLLFVESLVHTATPVLSETMRYALIYDFVPTWWVRSSDFEAPPKWTKSLRDRDLRALFTPGDAGASDRLSEGFASTN